MRSNLFKAILLGGVLLSGVAAAQAPSGDVSLYTSNNAEAVQAVVDIAKKRLPQVKIGAVTGGSATLLKRIEAEIAAPKADIFWSSSPNVLGGFKQLYAAYDSPESKAVPANYVEPGKLWTACNIHVVVMMVNTKQLAGLPAPKTWKDLADPRWKGKIIVADPNSSSTAYTVLWGASKVLDAEGFKILAKNVTVSRNASAVLNSVAQGEYAIGLTFESNAYAYVAGGQKEIKLVYAEDGTFVTDEAVVLVKNAPNAVAARALYDTLLSKEMQIELLERAFRRPSRTDIDVSKHVELPDIKSIKVFPIDEQESQAKRNDFLAQWAQLTAN
ncbi:MAG: extracellular solute-binding protein [Rhodospirillales bacterium]|nr:extracellular solute-binding protein [Rhodospirillales bacterium]